MFNDSSLIVVKDSTKGCWYLCRIQWVIYVSPWLVFWAFNLNSFVSVQNWALRVNSRWSSPFGSYNERCLQVRVWTYNQTYCRVLNSCENRLHYELGRDFESTQQCLRVLRISVSPYVVSLPEWTWPHFCCWVSQTPSEQSLKACLFSLKSLSPFSAPLQSTALFESTSSLIVI